MQGKREVPVIALGGDVDSCDGKKMYITTDNRQSKTA